MWTPKDDPATGAKLGVCVWGGGGEGGVRILLGDSQISYKEIKRCVCVRANAHRFTTYQLGETSKFIGCSIHIQQPAAAYLYIVNVMIPL